MLGVKGPISALTCLFWVGYGLRGSWVSENMDCLGPPRFWGVYNGDLNFDKVPKHDFGLRVQDAARHKLDHSSASTCCLSLERRADLWLAGNAGIEKKIDTATMGYIGITLRVHSFIVS